MAGGPVDVRIELNPNDLRAFLAALKRFEPKLATSTRRNLRKAGDSTIEEMRAELMSLPVKRNLGVREAIAGGIRLQIMTSKRSNGVRITVSGGPLVKALNRTSFRHPLFGNRERWYEQQGRPYFGAVLQRNRPQLLEAIQKALDEAVQAVNGA